MSVGRQEDGRDLSDWRAYFERVEALVERNHGDGASEEDAGFNPTAWLDKIEEQGGRAFGQLPYLGLMQSQGRGASCLKDEAPGKRGANVFGWHRFPAMNGMTKTESNALTTMCFHILQITVVGNAEKYMDKSLVPEMFELLRVAKGLPSEKQKIAKMGNIFLEAYKRLPF